MKYGKPVVASNVYGNIDVIDNNEIGLLFPLNKPDLLVEKIEYLKVIREHITASLRMHAKASRTVLI